MRNRADRKIWIWSVLVFSLWNQIGNAETRFDLYPSASPKTVLNAIQRLRSFVGQKIKDQNSGFYLTSRVVEVRATARDTVGFLIQLRPEENSCVFIESKGSVGTDFEPDLVVGNRRLCK